MIEKVKEKFYKGGEKMITIGNLKSEVKKRLKIFQLGNVLEITTYKRNRGIVIVKIEEEVFSFKEFGYEVLSVEHIGLEELLKLIQKRAKVEFPRSQQIRLYTHDSLEAHLISENIAIRI